MLDDNRRRSTGRGLEYTATSVPYRGYHAKAIGMRPQLGRPYQLSSSLPCHQLSIHDRVRPDFRKSSSQPSRSLSPPSMRYPSPSHDEILFHANKPLPTTPTDPHGSSAAAAAAFQLRKRRLPPVPMGRRSSTRDQSSLADPSHRSWKSSVDHHHQRRISEVPTPLGTYSDSEITAARLPFDRTYHNQPPLPQRAQPPQQGRIRRGSHMGKFIKILNCLGMES